MGVTQKVAGLCFTLNVVQLLETKNKLQKKVIKKILIKHNYLAVPDSALNNFRNKERLD